MPETPNIITKAARPAPRSFVVPIVKPIPTPTPSNGSDDRRIW